MANRTKKVITATLIRGSYYCYKGVAFRRNEPQTVESVEFADELEELSDVIKDFEGEAFNKPRFVINREATKVSAVQLSAKPEEPKPKKSMIRKRSKVTA